MVLVIRASPTNQPEIIYIVSWDYDMIQMKTPHGATFFMYARRALDYENRPYFVLGLLRPSHQEMTARETVRHQKYYTNRGSR